MTRRKVRQPLPGGGGRTWRVPSPSAGMDPGGIGARPISPGPWAPEGAAPEVGVLGLLLDDEEALHVREDRLDVLRHPCAPPLRDHCVAQRIGQQLDGGDTMGPQERRREVSSQHNSASFQTPVVLKQFPGEAARGRKKEQKTREK